ncbi:2-aminoadipate transaminase [Chthoniobacter flavus]|uniref:aminotransferase-like domain-containing protein n=1 Tax=Chthoniobacter flavus TaxID=191863 RepID=UPI00104FE7CC|nr:PLP-dependent aminotransferase family protein [Chthoniobacter flavus]TCO90584.1 2-aminoadipate transaminase [Chthoniobacter flavus]
MTEPRPFRAAGRLVDFMRQADEAGLINLAAGVPGLDSLPTEELQAAFTRAFAHEGAKMFTYHHPEGDHVLREQLAARLQARGANVRGPQLVTVTGCTQGVQLLISILVKPGDIVAVEAPAYYGMLEVLSVAGARVLPLPITGPDGIDLDATEELLTRWKPRALIVCAALSNPSGVTIPNEKRPRLVEICRQNGVRLIEDDIYGELIEDGVPRSLLAWDDGSTVSYVSSFSKSVSPGLRAGVCVPGTLYEDFAARKCQQDLHSAVVSEVALREFLAAGALDPHLAKLRPRNAHRRALALEAIARAFPKGTRANPPRGGYMLWAELPRAVDLAEVRETARQERIVFGAGPVFYTEPQPTSSLRLNCAKASEEELVSGLETLGAILCAAE